MEPILEVANKTFNIQSTFSRDLEDQDKTVDDLKINVERLPDVIGQIVDPIIQASNQGTVPNSTLYVHLCSTSKYIHTSINQSPFKSCFNLSSKKLVFFVSSKLEIETWCKKLLILLQITQPDRTLFLFKSIWTRPQGCQRCQKNRKGTRHTV